MPRNEMYDETRQQLRLLIGEMAYGVALKAMERLQAKIDNASYGEIVSTMGVLTNILR
jgi:hypothetical protein